MKTAILFLFFAICSNISLAQNNYLILNSRMPMHIESATTLEQGEMQWGLGYSSESKTYRSYIDQKSFTIINGIRHYKSKTVAEDRYDKAGILKLDYGIFDKLQFGLYVAATHSQYGYDEHTITLKYNIIPEDNILPSISLSTSFDGYIRDINGTEDFSFKAMLSKSFDKFRFHVNINNYNSKNSQIYPGRKFDIGTAVDYDIRKEKILLMGEIFINCIPDTRYEYRLGAKKQFGNDFLFYGGIGTAVSERFHPIYNFNAGITWYGFGFLKELI